MCDNILIIFKDPAKEPVWVTNKQELAVYCPKGIWGVDDIPIDLTETLILTDGDRIGDTVTLGETCMCDVDHNSTAFRNGFIYSKLDTNKQYDALSGYYRQYT
jgi:hypothetical protein